MTDFDVVVIGGGAAGLSAALVLSRALRKVAVVDAGAPRNAPAAHMHGFLSRDGTPPSDLVAAGRDEVAGYGGALINGSVDRVERDSGHWFRVVLADGSEMTTRRLVVATGLRDELPSIPGLHERWGRDVLHCPYCHGYEVRDQPIGVLGGPSRAIQQAQLVRQWSADVVFFVNGCALSTQQRDHVIARGVDVVDGTVTGLDVADDRMRGVTLDDGRIVPRAALFVSPHAAPNSELLLQLGCEFDDHGWVVAHASGRTSVAGVWVVGNVVNPRGQVITASSEGSTAAISLNWDLVSEDLHAEIRALHAASKPATRAEQT